MDVEILGLRCFLPRRLCLALAAHNSTVCWRERRR
jgi:hypothetical protein